ncbi:MAG: MFS transporter, partial [Alistipes sp.]|nr:MFS transporter [Alistipes sp.]
MAEKSKHSFQYWQVRTIIVTMVGYALFYFVRKNFSIAMPGLTAEFGISKVSLGLFLTLHGIIYGLSRFVNGVISDRNSARIV